MGAELSPSVSEEVKISSIQEPKFDLRIDRGNIAELAVSIDRHGLLHPILVRPVNDRFELVAGSRRLAAARLLGWRKITCQIIELNDQEAFEVALAENVNRKTLDQFEEAKAFKDYTSLYGWGSETELARKLGKSVSYVSRRLKLLTLPVKTQEILRRRKNLSLAAEILTIEDEELKNHLLALSSDIKLSNREVRRIKREFASKDKEFTWTNDPKTEEEKRQKAMKRTIQRTMVALKIAMHRLDDVIENAREDDWILLEILTQQRQELHSQINLISHVSKRIAGRRFL
ncbi:MAG: ParB/RepB/Spo0J family partition protein [Thaumarchaeota archaeon]|nr:ParB/RepB/Spo0J family partition protein [Nitrososphaerota archaeon]